MIKLLREDKKKNEMEENKEDPISLYISKSEWHQLSASHRNQLALDRYKDTSRRKTPWDVGIEYERYVGYMLEKAGYKVQYHGAIKGKEDLGIDLICENKDKILIVQCKRLSRKKGMPVRENVVAQTYGTTKLYKMKHSIMKNIIPVIVTSYELSKGAEDFAKYLGVVVRSNFDFDEYPMIKCNISNNTGKKIYHLPMDQQYDKIIIGDTEGDFYATTVIEAEQKGFRRAFRWRGNDKT